MEEHKYSLLSALGVGVGVGLSLGVGLAKPWSHRSHTSGTSQVELLVEELKSQILEGNTRLSTFDLFPYYLNEQTKTLLLTAACVHLKQGKFTRFTRNLSPASQTILLTGPQGSELYLQTLSKALAHHFDAKLILLDVSNLISKIQRKTGPGKLDPEPRQFTEYVSDVLSSLSSLTTDSSTESANASASNSDSNSKQSGAQASSNQSNTLKPSDVLRRIHSLGNFEDKSLATALVQVLASVSQSSPIILYVRDVHGLVSRSSKVYSELMKRIKKLAGPVLVLGSYEKGNEEEVSSEVESVFSYRVSIKPPEDQALLLKWQTDMEENMKTMLGNDCRHHILQVLASNDVECDDLSSIRLNDTVILSNFVEEILVSAISFDLMHTEEPMYRAGKLVISATSLAYGLELFQAGELDQSRTKPQAKADAQGTTAPAPEVNAEVPFIEAKTEAGKTETPVKLDGEKKATEGAKPAAVKPEVPDNEFEKRIRPEVIPSGEIGVTFEDIGALQDVKESLKELVLLPLRRPEIFSRGGLIKPCRGILLFGPPGTGKTMLAKAVATEAGASFINISMSSITSKWFGEDEKNVRALFTVAAKVAPTIVFIDEVDSMFGQRSRVGEHEAMRKIKNEFMSHWDGLLSKGSERVLVLAATNRPFDLDDAIIRRFERRIMVGLPDEANREKILRAILAKEQLSDDFDFMELANMTEGYSGSDLKNLCTAAAYRPIRELLKKERENVTAKLRESSSEASESKEAETPTPADSEDETPEAEKAASKSTGASEVETSGEPVITLRPLNMSDMKEARKQISASFSTEGAGMAELKEWNELYGEGGSRKKKPLTYFI